MAPFDDRAAAQAIDDAQAAAADARQRTVLEHLLRVSVQLAEAQSIDAVLASVCAGVRTALGFRKVTVELVGAGRADVARLRADAREVEGCYLLPDSLVVPLHDEQGRLVGVIRADEPAGDLPPSGEGLRAVRVFADQATAAVASAAAFEELRFLADHDPLTRLGNRRAFTRRLAEEAHRSARYGRRFALVVLDLDGFKGVNDRDGHEAGDAALRAVGDVLADSLRRSDCAFRLGGDEFALLLEEAGVREATMAVDRVAGRIAAVAAGEGHMLRASFGVALAEVTPDPEALLRAADAAMYEAKRAGAGVRFASG
jgi:diguanylate cyclase (GGDEF)-like protein